MALVVGLSVLAVPAWASTSLSRVLGHEKPAGDGRFRHAQRGTAATRQPRHPDPAEAGVLTGVAAASAASAVGQPTAPTRRTPPGCPAADVVVSLLATQAAYSARQLPEFAVDVVSTASYTCSLDIGARHVVLQISAGPALIWTSADCAEGQASQATTLRRGVPAVVPMTWDEQYSTAGCPVPGRAALPGSYTATAADGSAVSNAVTFRIS